MSVDRSIAYSSSEACHGTRLEGIRLEFIGVKRETMAKGGGGGFLTTNDLKDRDRHSVLTGRTSWLELVN